MQRIVTDHDETVRRVRSICEALPDVDEEPAWVGVRWRVRGRTFAHLLTIDDGKPQAHARAVGHDGPLTVVTFRSVGEEQEVLRQAGWPYFFGGWGREVVGIVLDGGVDWAEVGELLTESYCVLAPAKLVAQVDRPAG